MSTLDDFLTVILRYLAPGAAVLDVGCGSGALVEELGIRGLHAQGIDKNETQHAQCRQIALEDYAADEPFDGVTARLSLHHMRNIGDVYKRLRSLLKPAGFLLIAEFGWENIDLQTLGWARESLRFPGPHSRAIDYASGSLTEALQRWVCKYGDLHSGAAMLQGADAFFTRTFFEYVPYLAWMSDAPTITSDERLALSSNSIRPIGFVYVGTLRPVL